VCAPDAARMAERLGGIARALGRDEQAEPALRLLG
jgi:5-(carboxyamino)imidazole ribonucleotide synthase